MYRLNSNLVPSNEAGLFLALNRAFQLITFFYNCFLLLKNFIIKKKNLNQELCPQTNRILSHRSVESCKNSSIRRPPWDDRAEAGCGIFAGQKQ